MIAYTRQLQLARIPSCKRCLAGSRFIVLLITFVLCCCTSCNRVEKQIARLHDPDPGVRSDAAGALGSSADVRAVKPLAELADHDPEVIVRSRALAALVTLGAPGLREILVHLGDDSATNTWRFVKELCDAGIHDQKSIKALLNEWHSSPKQFGRAVGVFLNYAPISIAEFAVDILSNSGSEAAVPLIVALSPSQLSSFEKVEEAIIKCGDAAVEPLIACVEDPQYRYSKLKLIELLGRLGDVRAAGPVGRFLENSSRKRNAYMECQSAARALEKLGTPGADELLRILADTRWTDDPEYHTDTVGMDQFITCPPHPAQREAAAALARLHDQRAVEPLRGYLCRGHADKQMVQALNKLYGKTEFTGKWAEWVEWVYLCSWLVHKNITDNSSRSRLVFEADLDSTNAVTAFHAFACLISLGDTQSYPALIRFLNSQKSDRDGRLIARVLAGCGNKYLQDAVRAWLGRFDTKDSSLAYHELLHWGAWNEPGDKHLPFEDD